MEQETIFDETFDAPTRRRALMSQWLKVYTWLIMLFGAAYFFWAVFFTPPVPTGTGTAYLYGAMFRQFAPGIIIFMMGALVWLEKEHAIRFNHSTAVIWAISIVISVFIFGVRGLKNAMFIPIFIPYWIGLHLIKKPWENEAVAGKDIL